MATMSKYASLPDIDTQPDVYETPDALSGTLRSEGTESIASDDESEDVVRATINVKDATSKFSDAIVDATDADFSDTIRSRKKSAYRSMRAKTPTLETEEYEIVGREDLMTPETRMQKLRRLMFEVQELAEDVQKPNMEEDKAQSASILAQIEALQHDLARLNQTDALTSTESKNRLNMHLGAAKHLVSQIEAFKNQIHEDKPSESPSKTGTSEKNDYVSYELFYNRGATQAEFTKELSLIDQRIASIETILGETREYQQSTSIFNAMEDIKQQLDLLTQPRNMEQLNRQVKGLLTDLDRLNDLRQGLSYGSSGDLNDVKPASQDSMQLDSETTSKINYLFDALHRVDPLLPLTTATLTRLKSLQQMHTEAASFSTTVNMIAKEQDAIQTELSTIGASCAKMESSLRENESTIQSNIQTIDARLTHLVERLEQLRSSA